jgi:hypothetical protein
MNTYTKLRFHLERHMYKRGRNKGDAPADASRRSKDHFRVIKGNDDTYRVRMYGTDILTAYPDGNVMIDTKGYYTHNTTIIRLNEALSWFFEDVRSYMHKRRVFSYSQPVIRVGDKTYRYYDGITFNAQGEILTQLQAFEQKRIDKAESKEFTQGLKDSGFKDAFKLLYAATEVEEDMYHSYRNLPDMLTDNAQAHHWVTVIQAFKFERDWWGSARWKERSDAKTCWASIMQYCKKNMYVVLPSTTYVL